MANPNSNPNIPTWSFTPASTGAQTATSTPAYSPQFQSQFPPTNTPLPSSPRSPGQEQDTTFRPPPNYPAAFTPRPRAPRSRSGSSNQSTFHHYQPRSQPATNTTTSSHPITAPFQLPRMPAWPSPEFVMGQTSGRAQGVGHQPQPENVPIDPRLLGDHGASSGGSRHGSDSSQHGRGQGGWSGGSSGT
ncbi:hypothetical protein K491DRAFT_687313 [Lophiostoma macrostomum CBS 122681]|uniref:Uncharacterized protein n=1 Tax=Lophiostoma macrostomum CBS 122681 TaxID=1314788 RepID=A0A6A6TP31_9PLEO|nr:hypothetical protein K491DRAFT_687313 [Lophiostoma macrostomum CBS 122681]